MVRRRSQQTAEFDGQNSRDARTGIPIKQFQIDKDGRRDKQLTWRVRGGLAQVPEFGPKPNPIVSIQGFRAKDGRICVSLVDGPTWQGHCGIESSGWDDGGFAGSFQILDKMDGTAALYTLISIPPPGNTLGAVDDFIFFSEGIGSLSFITAHPAPFGDVTVPQTRGRPYAPNLDFSSCTTLQIDVASSSASPLASITLTDGLAASHTEVIGVPGPAFATFSIPLALFTGGGVDISDITAIEYTVIDDFGGVPGPGPGGTWNFDRLGCI